MPQDTLKKDEGFQVYDGGPSAEPVLSSKKGINRIVWDMHHATMVGVPTAFLEANFRGHKAIPGEYTINLRTGKAQLETKAKILPNPLYEVSPETYETFHQFMDEAEHNLNEMHITINLLMKVQKQIQTIVDELPKDPASASLKEKGNLLLTKLKAWDEDMIQRKSKAYDDVENFTNKFTAEYLFLINHTDSAIPKVNKPSKDRMEELNAVWKSLQERSDFLREVDIPAYNQILWEAGVGALRLK